MAAHDVKSTKLFTSKITNLIDLESTDYKMSKTINMHKKQENDGFI
jgi:hypothetical protein